MKQGGGKEIDISHIKMEGVMGKFAIGIKHFKVMTEAVNIYVEEQMPQIVEVIPPTPAVSEAIFNQVDHKATADA